jgi:hypothetical protein
VLVPSDLTLEQLHDVLQLAIGWEDCHMHEFRIGQQRFGKSDPMEQAFGGSRTASERTARLFNVLGRAGAKAVYTYDFGDGWQHQLAVEKRLAPEPGRAYPACLAGERHGPPEDCGGHSDPQMMPLSAQRIRTDSHSGMWYRAATDHIRRTKK